MKAVWLHRNLILEYLAVCLTVGLTWSGPHEEAVLMLAPLVGLFGVLLLTDNVKVRKWCLVLFLAVLISTVLSLNISKVVDIH